MGRSQPGEDQEGEEEKSDDEGAGARVLAVSEKVPDGAGAGRTHEDPLGARSPWKGGQEEDEEAELLAGVRVRAKVRTRAGFALSFAS